MDGSKLSGICGCKFDFDVSGVHFKKALFVPNISVYNKVWSSALPLTDSQVDLSWQLTLQKVWENLISQKGIILVILLVGMVSI